MMRYTDRHLLYFTLGALTLPPILWEFRLVRYESFPSPITALLPPIASVL